MSLRNYVRFVADFPNQLDGGSPPGFELASFLSSELQKRDFDSKPPVELDGFAWEFATADPKFRIFTLIGLDDDTKANPRRQWLVTNDSIPGILTSIFGGKKSHEKREAYLRRYCEAVHAIISADERFSEISWHTGGLLEHTHDSAADHP